MLPIPVDISPIRSPQAVHVELARRFAKSNVIEIGTRNGDGIVCFAQAARSAIAVELVPEYCDKLRARASAAAAGAHRSFVVDCHDFHEADFHEADFITWWEQPGAPPQPRAGC